MKGTEVNLMFDGTDRLMTNEFRSQKGETKMDNLKGIYENLRSEIEKTEPQVMDLEKKVNEYKALLEESENELKKLNDVLFALKNAFDSMELIDGINGTVEIKQAEEVKPAEKKEETAVPYRKVKQIDWKTKDRKVIVIKNGEIVGKFSTQSRAAKFLGWTQSGVSAFMRQDEGTQLRKKGLVIKWE